MKVSYRKSYYKVGLKDFIIIEKEKIILLLKRFYRGFKRAKEHLKPLIIVIILSVIYIIITYFIGNFLDKNISISDSIWDARELIFSSLIIVFAVDFSSKERKRKENLKEQQYILTELLCQSEGLLTKLTGCLGIEYEKPILLSKNLYNQFKNNLNKAKIPNKIITDQGTFDDIEWWVKDLEIVYEKINKNIKKEKFKIGKNDDKNIYMSLNNYCHYLSNNLNKDYPPCKLKNQIIDLAYEMLIACAYLRRVWMWDYDRNQKIRGILLNSLSKDDDNYYEISKWF